MVSMFNLLFLDLEKENIFQSISMDDVSISMDGDSPRPARIHRMQVLRMRLLYFANSLHNYIMTRVCLITKLFVLPDKNFNFNYRLCSQDFS